ncbi:MAG: lipopolysaccharide kinase InaA family protein [Planctomycetota bacterium]
MTEQNSDTDEYITIERRPWRWIVRADRRKLIDSPVFQHFDALIEDGKVTPTTLSVRKTTVIAPADIAMTNCDLIVKHYRVTHWYQKLRSWFRRMIGVKELRLGRELLRRGIPVSAPVAAGERRRFRMVCESFVALDRLPDAMDFELYALRVRPESLAAGDLRTRRKAIRDLGALVRRLHNEGVYQYDCNPCNFLVDPGTHRLTFIDLAKVRIYRHLPQRKVLENLAKLARHREMIPVTDLMRFLRGYTEGTQGRKEDRFALFRKVEMINRKLVAGDVQREGRRCLKAGRRFAKVRRGGRWGIFNKTGYKLKEFDEVLLSNFIGTANEATRNAELVKTHIVMPLFGEEIQADILAGTYASLKYIYQRKSMLFRAGFSGDMPLALLGYLDRGIRRGFLFSRPDAAPVKKKAVRTMAFLNLRQPPVQIDDPSVLISYARGRMLEQLRGDGFYLPPDGADDGEEWFALRKNFGDYHLAHIALRLGRHRESAFFRLEVGTGLADLDYSQLEWGSPQADGGKKPFSEVVLETRWGRFRQKSRNLFTLPERWNISAYDTFYFNDSVEFEIGLERAVALVRKYLPGFLENLKKRVHEGSAVQGHPPA